MADLTTLTQVKAMHRIDSSDHDTLLGELILAASGRIYGYLEWAEADYEDSAGLISTVPERVKIATAMLVGYMFDHPQDNPDDAYGHGRLPYPVTAILYDLRDPPLA